jgi:hypothetical protein
VRWLLGTLLLTACARPEVTAPAVRHVTDPRSADSLHAAVHDVLAQRCGECHEGSRASAVPEALAVFDLDRSDWPTRFDSQRRFEVALQRLSGAPAADKALLLAFRDTRL